MKKNDNKCSRIGLIMFSFVLILSCLYVLVYAGDLNENERYYTGILRLHVVANSDTDEDQALKLEVRDRILEDINQGLVKEIVKSHQGQYTEEISLSKEAVNLYVEKNVDKIKKDAEELLESKGKKYPITVTLEKCFIPEKKYGDVVFPAGNYDALKIKIGEGRGENWWCVLFPPLCIIDPEGESLEGLQIDEEDKERKSAIRLEFKCKEFLDRYWKDGRKNLE